jgi:hypothetical protein
MVVSFPQTCAGRKTVTAGGMPSGGRFRGRPVDRGEREASGAADADGRQSVSGMRLGFTSSDAGSAGVRMAPEGSPGFTGDVQLKQRRSRDAAFLVCENRRLRGWRLGPRSGAPRWRLMALRASGRNGIGFGWQGRDFALAPRRWTWAPLVRRGRKNSWLRWATVAADPNTAVRGRLGGTRRCCGTSLRQANEGGTRGGRREGRTAVRRRDEVRDGGDDADGCSVIGRREGGVLSMAKRHAFL